MTLTDLAARIDAHLRRMEKDPSVNAPELPGFAVSRPFNSPTAARATGGVSIRYSFIVREWSKLDRPVAERYLAWLDAGNGGRHWEMEHETPAQPKLSGG